MAERNMDSPSPTVLAYLAGMIDGDGFISITRSVRAGKEYFGAQVGISGTRREPHDLAASLWGGSVSAYVPKNPNHRVFYHWQRVGMAATQIIDSLFPYLLIKKDHALLVMEFSEHFALLKSDNPFAWKLPDYDPIAEMRRMRDDMIDLNQSRKKVGRRNVCQLQNSGITSSQAVMQ